jgi:hypothetical protein
LHSPKTSVHSNADHVLNPHKARGELAVVFISIFGSQGNSVVIPIMLLIVTTDKPWFGSRMWERTSFTALKASVRHSVLFSEYRNNSTGGKAARA